MMKCMRCSRIALFMAGCVICFNLYLFCVFLKDSEDGNKSIITIKSLFTYGLRSKEDEMLTLYEHYSQDGIKEGLTATAKGFLLNGKDITIFSGAIHYFRVHPRYWRDRLRKLRAAGFVAVETYVPWNLHEPEKGSFDFGDGDNDMSLFLDVVKYIRLAQDEDLLVLVRPGPYICAEWDFGGLPSWLLRDPKMQVRTSNKQFMDSVTNYFDKLLPLFTDLQFTDGGPIIGFQIENEYGAVAAGMAEPDKRYLQGIKDLFEKHGLSRSLLFTADMPSMSAASGALDGVLMTANFKSNPDGELTLLAQLQPGKPLIVMEYWTGWFDHWLESHNVVPTTDYIKILESILKFPSSVNLYMFHGGTNFGFMNGANVQDDFPVYQSDVTSYDYDALLTESGDYTTKYHATARLVKQFNPVKTWLPEPPPPTDKVAYPPAAISAQMDFDTLVGKVPEEDRVKSKNLIPMEMLDVNHGNGQSYGFVLYRKVDAPLLERSVLRVKGQVRDLAVVLLDGRRKSLEFTKQEQLPGFGFWENRDSWLTLRARENERTGVLDILVENWGRVNYGQTLAVFDQRKGLVDCSVLLDNHILQNWSIIALQFKSKWLTSLEGWGKVSPASGPALYKATLTIDKPHDTFLDMSAWGKGNVFVNGFNIGRYFSGGPSRTLYVPAPFLVAGTNQVMTVAGYVCFVALVLFLQLGQPCIN